MPLPDEGIKIAALPVASSPDAIDLVGVQAGVTKKLASTLLATQAELDAETTARTNADALKANDNAVVHLSLTETITGAKTFTGATAFDLFTGGATKSLNFRPALGDNGLSLGIQSKDWSGDSNFDGLQINGSDGIGFGVSGGVRKIMFDTNGNVQAVGSNSFFGAGALGAAGAYIKIGDQGDASSGYLIADGSGADIVLALRSKGTGNIKFQRGNSGDIGYFTPADPAADQTHLVLRCNVGGLFVERRVLVGALGSGPGGVNRALYIT